MLCQTQIASPLLPQRTPFFSFLVSVFKVLLSLWCRQTLLLVIGLHVAYPGEKLSYRVSSISHALNYKQESISPLKFISYFCE